MPKAGKASNNCKAKINKVELTDERITGRGGISLFSRYLENSGILLVMTSFFGCLRKSTKGLPIEELFKQILCFFMEGSSRRLVHFDHLAADKAYAGAIQTKPEFMASSHTIKRFMKSFSFIFIWLFRRILLNLFIWRLKIEQPEVITLGIDLVVLDNSDAQKREGVEYTYKKINGFGVSSMIWNNLVIDGSLRSGDKHSNHGKSVHRMVKRVVEKIRAEYRNVPIIFRLDSGYMDQDLFNLFEELGVKYTCSGKMYNDMSSFLIKLGRRSWQRHYGKGPVEDSRIWEYTEFGDRRGTWDKFRRCLCYRPMCNEVGQFYLPCTLYCHVIYTNLGIGDETDVQLKKVGYNLQDFPEAIIDFHHGRGDDELVFRAMKDFGGEVLPFEKFKPNAVYFYCMLIGYFAFDCFKNDICTDVVKPRAYPTTVRRVIIDIGAKITSHGGQIIVKVAKAVWEDLNFKLLWERSSSPPKVPVP